MPEIFPYKKKIWKIASLWEKVYHSGYTKDNERKQPDSISFENISHLYEKGISIHNPDFHRVKVFSFRNSENPVHSDDYGEYFGLRDSQVLERDGKVIYLFDNHNKIIQPFLEYVEIIGRAFDVVHIDAHNDDAVFVKQKPHHLELKKVQEYITKTRISNFFDFLSEAVVPVSHIVVASGADRNEAISKEQVRQKISEIISQARDDKLENKLIQNIYRYTKSIDFKAFKKPKNPYILSLDIDIFGPEGDFIDLESKIKIIAEAWQNAELVTIATSPGFIDQRFAAEIIRIFSS